MAKSPLRASNYATPKGVRKTAEKPVQPQKPVEAVTAAKIENAAPAASPVTPEATPCGSSVTADEWAEQLRRSLNTFVGVARMARIGGGATLPEVATDADWLRLFGEWRATH